MYSIKAIHHWHLGHTFEQVMSVQATNGSWRGGIDTSAGGLGPNTQAISEQIAIDEESHPGDEYPEFPFHIETYIAISRLLILHESWSLPSCTAVTISCGVTIPERLIYFNWSIS